MEFTVYPETVDHVGIVQQHRQKLQNAISNVITNGHEVTIETAPYAYKPTMYIGSRPLTQRDVIVVRQASVPLNEILTGHARNYRLSLRQAYSELRDQGFDEAYEFAQQVNDPEVAQWILNDLHAEEATYPFGVIGQSYEAALQQIDKQNTTIEKMRETLHKRVARIVNPDSPELVPQYSTNGVVHAIRSATKPGYRSMLAERERLLQDVQKIADLPGIERQIIADLAQQDESVDTQESHHDDFSVLRAQRCR